jgi:uncharacterized membrane protein YeaQ/YmgE (transglycosylase-associated protein family)
MDLVIWLAIGATIGWLGSLRLKSDPEQGVFMNVVVGVVGALIGGWLVGPRVGVAFASRGAGDAMGFVAALVGAVVLLALFDFARRRRLR